MIRALTRIRPATTLDKAMEITPELLHHLGRLSRLALSPAEEAKLEQDLKGILALFEKLGELETAGLPEMARPVELENRLRADVTEPSLPPQKSLSVAVESEEGFFKVPRVIE